MIGTRSARTWVVVLALVLLAGCSGAGNYIKDNYPLIDVQGTGKAAAKVYLMEGFTVPKAAQRLSSEEKPEETSKESEDQMFLVYDDKLIHLQKVPDNPANTIAEVESIEYARRHYDSSFLQTYLTAALLQSMFGGGWYEESKPYNYRGYTKPAAPRASSSKPQAAEAARPSTSERTGSFGTGSPSPPKSTIGTRKNDGSTPSYKASAPHTSKRSGSFSSKKR